MNTFFYRTLLCAIVFAWLTFEYCLAQQQQAVVRQNYALTLGTIMCRATLTIYPNDSTYPAQMRTIMGTYLYNHKGIDIELLSDTAYFTSPTILVCKLRESYFDRTKSENDDAEITGFWDIMIRFDTTQKPIRSTIEGSWWSNDRKRTLPIQSQSCIGYSIRQHPTYDISTQYAVLPSPYQAITDILKQTAQKSYQDASKEIREEEQELALINKDAKNSADSIPLRYSVLDIADVAYTNDSIVSIATTYYAYTGGAHGITTQSARNFYRAKGMSTFREITLADIFRSATPRTADYIGVLNTLLLGALRKQKAEWVRTSELNNLTKDLRAGAIPFCILQAGIALYFNQYYAGPYAQGIFTVVLPYTQLRDLIPAQSPVFALVPKKK
jgi:hypothetical protein